MFIPVTVERFRIDITTYCYSSKNVSVINLRRTMRRIPLATQVILVFWTGCMFLVLHYNSRRNDSGREPLTAQPHNRHVVAARVCTQEERLRNMRRVCALRYEPNQEFVRAVEYRSVVDHNHKLRLCFTSKAGCTALKAAIVESNGFDLWKQTKESQVNAAHSIETFQQLNMTYMDRVSQAERIRIAHHYYSLVAIRHPLERILSYYRDKIVDDDIGSAHAERTAEVLRASRPELFAANADLRQAKYPQRELGPPSFEEFMAWVYKEKVVDEHWLTIYNSCNVCYESQYWHAILRMETMATDQHVLLARLNSSLSSVPVRHTHQHSVSGLSFQRELPEYRDVSDDAIKYFLDMHEDDMELFGYGWDGKTNTAYCAIQTDDGVCC